MVDSTDYIKKYKLLESIREINEVLKDNKNFNHSIREDLDGKNIEILSTLEIKGRYFAIKQDILIDDVLSKTLDEESFKIELLRAIESNEKMLINHMTETN